MRKIGFALILILSIAGLARAQQKQVLSVAAATCTTTGTSCLINSVDPTSGGATFTVSANTSGNTLQFEASGDSGTTWVALNATPSNSATAASSTTSTGTWQANISAYTNVRIRMSTLAGGTSTVSIIFSTASARGGSAGGGGTVTGTGASTQIAYWTGASSLGGDSNLTRNSTLHTVSAFNPPNGPSNGFLSSYNSTPAVLGSGGFSTFFSAFVSPTSLSRSAYACIATTPYDPTDSCLITQDSAGNLSFGIGTLGNFLWSPLVAPIPISGYPTLALLEIDASAHGVTFTHPVIDLVNNSTATPTGLEVVRGLGLGSNVILRETIQESDASFAHYTWNKSGPAGNNFSEFMANDGGYAIDESPNGVLTEHLHFNASGSVEITPDPTSSGVILDTRTRSPVFIAGTDNSVAGSVQIANGSANAHTTFSSAATTTNTIAGFATVPTTGHMVTCTTAATTCTLTDGGAPATGTVTSIATTSPITGGTITTTGTIACATCTTNASALTNNVLVKGAGGQATQTSSVTDNGTTVSTTEGISGGSFSTATNCTSSASPAVCGSAAAGTVVIAAAATTVVVNTTAVTANSEIFIQFDSSLGTKLSVTCNTTVDLGQLTARSGGTSFTITAAATPAVNPACYSYHIVN